MKISSFELGCRFTEALRTERSADYSAVFFKSSVFLRSGKNEILAGKNCAVIFSCDSPWLIRSADGNDFTLDKICFRLTPADLQYIASLNIPFDTPIELREQIAIGNIMKALQSHSFYSDSNMDEFGVCALKMLLMDIGSQLEKRSGIDISSVPYYFRLKEIRCRIYDDPSYNWNIDNICSELGISRTYFHRIYMTAFGTTCIKDVIDSRIALAEKMLAETDMSVYMIAKRCGYESDSYFMRQFKAKNGCTPTVYRRRLSTVKKSADNK